MLHQTHEAPQEAMPLPPPGPPKALALEVLRDLPNTASWDRILYELSVCEALCVSMEDVRAGRLIDDDDIKAEFGLTDD